MAGQARDAGDLRQLLDVTGLWPAQDDEAIREPPTVWGSGYIRRRDKRIP